MEIIRKQENNNNDSNTTLLINEKILISIIDRIYKIIITIWYHHAPSRGYKVSLYTKPRRNVNSFKYMQWEALQPH